MPKIHYICPVHALAEKVNGAAPAAPLVARERPQAGTLPFLEPAHKRPGPIDLNTQRIGLFFYDGHIRPHGGAHHSLTTRVGSKVTARSYNELLSLSVATGTSSKFTTASTLKSIGVAISTQRPLIFCEGEWGWTVGTRMR